MRSEVVSFVNAQCESTTRKGKAMGNSDFHSMGTWWEKAYDSGDAESRYHHVETQDEKLERTQRQVSAIGRDKERAIQWTVQVGDEHFQCPILELDNGMWALVGDMCFPVKKRVRNREDLSFKIFILNETMSQQSLHDLIARHPCWYEFVKWF